MAKKDAQTKTADASVTTHSGTTSERRSEPRCGPAKQKPQPHRAGTSKQAREVENLSREKAWQSNRRLPFGECKDVPTERPSRDVETAEGGTKRTTKTTEAIAKDPSPTGIQAARPTSGGRTGRSKEPGAITRDGDTQRYHTAAVRDASRGRARVRYPTHERSATTRSPSAGSYTTARSLGVIIPRHCTATRRRRPLSTDPVALYHYYQSEWNHFREQIPGESSHADLRWIIRARLMDPS